MNRPISVGITGGIGSGKTLISRLFSLINIPVYNADNRAKELMNTTLIHPITNAFGSDSYVDGILNRDYIAQQVFNNKEKLQVLNAIVHPAVAIDFETWIEQQSNVQYVLKEAALLIESGSYKQLDKLIVITSPYDLRVERIKKRDAFRSVNEIEKIISNQTSDSEKEKLADFIIRNDEQSMLIPQMLEIDKKIRQHLKHCLCDIGRHLSTLLF